MDLTGTISSPDCAVTVNGVNAINQGNTWSATGVPVLGSGTAVFSATAAKNSATVASAELEVEIPFTLTTYYGNWSAYNIHHSNGYNSHEDDAYTYIWNFSDAAGGAATKISDCDGVVHTDVSTYDNTGRWIGGSSGSFRRDGWSITGPTGSGCLFDGFSEVDPVNAQIYRNYFAGETADARMKLTMGGKSRVGHQALVVLNAYDLWELKKPFQWGAGPFPDGEFFSPQDQPRNMLSIPGLGSFDSSGLLFVLLCENETLDVTPQAALPYYWYWLRAEKHALGVYNDGVDVTDGTVKVVVGENVGLTAGIVSRSTDGALIEFSEPLIKMNTWTVGGNYLTGYQHDTIGKEIKNLDLTRPQINFFYKEGGCQKVECKCDTPAGPLTARTTVSTYRPSAKIWTSTDEVTLYDNTLKFGYFLTKYWASGIKFTGEGDSVLGSYKYVQTGKVSDRVLNNAGEWVDIVVGEGLDNVYPYANDLVCDDSPSIGPLPTTGVCTVATLDYDMDMFLMFTSKKAGSTEVPLRKVHWNCKGAARLTNGAWELTPGSVDHSTNPSDQDTTSYPKWESLIQNNNVPQ